LSNAFGWREETPSAPNQSAFHAIPKARHRPNQGAVMPQDRTVPEARNCAQRNEFSWIWWRSLIRTVGNVDLQTDSDSLSVRLRVVTAHCSLGTSLLSVQSSKGLEFRSVIFIGLGQIKFSETQAAQNMKLPYVGMTRAKD